MEIQVLCDRISQFTAERFLERKVSEYFPTTRRKSNQAPQMGKREDPVFFIFIGHVTTQIDPMH